MHSKALLGVSCVLWLSTPGGTSHNLFHLRMPQSRIMTNDNMTSNTEDQNGLKHLYPWYHTTAELNAEVKRLAQNCGGLISPRTVREGDVAIDVVRVRAPGTNPMNRVFMMFGEHSRELIGPESGLYFLRVLCGDMPIENDIGTVASILHDNEFELVLNGNPRSRLNVETGQFCLRSNPQGVDLNRNWDEKWNLELPEWARSPPGPHPFSEPETRLLKMLVSQYKPTTFFTVHSGTIGMYMPWAYNTSNVPTRNQPSMLQILKEIGDDYCQCPYGAAGNEIGYSSPGTSMDWVYDKLQTPYVFAFEIYTSPEREARVRSHWEEKIELGKLTLLQTGVHLGHRNFVDIFQKHSSDFVQTAKPQQNMDSDLEEPAACFRIFNPSTHDAYNETIKNWVAAYLKTCQKVVADIRIGDSTNSMSKNI